MDRLAEISDSLSNLTLYDIKSYYNQAKNAVLNVSEMEAKVREATNDEPWGASSTLMQEIAQGTFNFQHFNEIMPAIYARFMEREAHQWRQIYKALQLLEYLIKNGSERVVDDARSHIGTIKMLRNFYYVDQKGKDQGMNVRHRSKELVELLGDVDKIRGERRKAKINKTKYTGTGNDGMSFSSGGRYGGFGSDSLGSGSGYGGGDYDNYADSGSSGYGGSSSNSRRTFQEYDAGDDDILHKRSNSAAGNTSSTRASSTLQRSSTLPTAAPPEPPKPKQPEVNLLDLDDDFGVLAPVQQKALPAGGTNPLPTGGDDDFDDFQSAPPSAAMPNNISLNPIASAPTVPTALPPALIPQPIAPISPPVTQPQVGNNFANNSLFTAVSASATPAMTSFMSPAAVPMQNHMNHIMQPMMASPPSMMGAPMVPNQPAMTPTSPPARTPATSAAAAAQQKPNANFDDLWSMSLASGGVGKADGGNLIPQKSMKALGQEKAQAQMWGTGQVRPMGTGSGSFTGAPTTNTAAQTSNSSNGLDDLLF